MRSPRVHGWLFLVTGGFWLRLLRNCRQIWILNRYVHPPHRHKLTELSCHQNPRVSNATVVDITVLQRASWISQARLGLKVTHTWHFRDQIELSIALCSQRGAICTCATFLMTLLTSWNYFRHKVNILQRLTQDFQRKSVLSRSNLTVMNQMIFSSIFQNYLCASLKWHICCP